MQSEPIDLKNLSATEISTLLERWGYPGYRAKQVYGWIHRGVRSFADMTNLPADLRAQLEAEARLTALTTIGVQESRKDGTRKYLFGLADGQAVESVYMKHAYGAAVCVSSQAGCAMGCAFCASTAEGLARDLTAAEMLDQIDAIRRDTGEAIARVDVMGSGEPLLNYDSLKRFLKLLHDPAGRNLSYRSVTVSTCGVVPGIAELGRDFPQVNLAVSLHAPNDGIRNQLMPVNRSWPIGRLLAACRRHAEQTGRRVTYEYILIRGRNDRPEHAEELSKRLRGTLCHVNLIRYNPIDGGAWKTPDETSARRFAEALTAFGISATIRRSLGADIDGACGQLRLRRVSEGGSESATDR